MRVVCYSAIYGDRYDTPKSTFNVGARCVLYTDNPDLKAPGWEIRYDPLPRFSTPMLRAKYWKCHPNLAVPDADVTLWIDGSIIPGEGFANRCVEALGQDDIAFTPHPLRDCAPGDQRVTTVNRGQVRIDELRDDDRLVTYDSLRRRIHAGGRDHRGYAFRRAVRQFTGDLIVMTTDETRVRVTGNHYVPVRWRDTAATAYAVYLMRKGDWWRVGKSQLHNRVTGGRAFGPSSRARSEGADALWLLGVYETSAEALLAEQYVSAAYGVTQAMFHNPSGGVRRATVSDAMLKDLHTRLAARGSGERARTLLRDYRLEIDHPIWTPAGAVLGPRSPFKIRAANVVSGWMEVGIADGQRPCWEPVTVTHEPVVDIPVYSLDVDRHHSYIGDGQVLFNCIYTELDASIPLPKYHAPTMIKQVQTYREMGHPEHWGLFASGIMVRRNKPAVNRLNVRWWGENWFWSWQDQLSLPVVTRDATDVTWNTNLPWAQWWNHVEHGTP